MIDERLDKRLVELNKRYQDLFYSVISENARKKDRYITNIKKLNIKRIIQDLRYREYAKNNFSVKGNKYPAEIIKKCDISSFKIAVYSCITGKYDKIIDPIYIEDGVDYFMYTDTDLPKDSAWTKCSLSECRETNYDNPLMINRKIKILQTERLLNYDYTVYVDGNIEIVSGISPIISDMGERGFGVHFHRSRDCIYDELVAIKHLKRIKGEELDIQVNSYKNEGYPRHNGMFENSILIRNNRNQDTLDLMKDWWEEYLRFPTRDQVSLPYVMWKTDYEIKNVFIMGNDIEKNPRFNRFYQHA